ncbi:alpha/beta hydrolase [Cyanobacterium aponinum UTEX 3222]|uniref:Alpha/beta hydrolase n=2 Tax=Cyanobacterium aponinum TaxID=379064 RepID=A0A844GRB5_9CHRO|nr:alpha/beta hydrolase [Cyanobacterium aponinum]WRL40458.1 alpha/beta hydrolase [Cyanobacterium aponinum UTEX 3222]MBD2393163.1 alpha/beta hydrolase [Cyanobacterium aponinum FACHB-4101]MTF37469.1 alpha/beta hydrolase [Cyanobacterium aponinum 0216]PHV62359.1 dienelactone hydrolase [Cyanobacterium aponinum IPPAS B-1201]WPF87308.1 alpha/beta hydrolase [Cyanobacterium aponinum AL20115]
MIFSPISFGKKLTAISLSFLSLGIFNVKTSYSADNIFFVYSPLIASLRVESLEKFAKDGTVNQNLGFYLNLARVNEQQKAEFRRALTTPVKVDPVLLSRILNTDEAERLLNYFGSVINIRGGSNGKFLLRGALIKSAMEEDGLTLLNVLRNLAVDIQINIPRILNYSEQINLVVNGSDLFVDEVARLGEKEAELSEPVDFSKLTDIRQLGSFSVTNSRLNLLDSTRNRELYVEIFQPAELKGENIPVVIFSHGLSSRPEDFSRWATHLASYGYVVVLPQHPGSDTQQTEDFLAGFSRQIFRLNEFIDRPLDITFVLNELTRLNNQQFGGKLNLESVGVGGHSFGGYTALAVAGAKINFQQLERSCNLEIGNLNTALLLQCRALQLPRKDYNFRDERVKAVFTINPVNASIFGIDGLNNIDIPLFVAAGSYDPATPFVFEQARTFPFLTDQNVYLQLQEGQAHVDFSQLDAGITDLIETVGNLTLPSPYLLDEYTNSMTLAFFQVHLRNEEDYRVFLQSSYAQYLSQGQDFKTFLITSQFLPELRDKYKQFLMDNYDLIFR